MAGPIVVVTKTNLDRAGSPTGHRMPDKRILSPDDMESKGRKRTATAEQYARRHLLRRLREAGHKFSTDLNRAFEWIYAVGVEKQGKQSRLQMIPREAFVVDQQSSDDILDRVGGMKGLHTIPSASNEVHFQTVPRRR